MPVARSLCTDPPRGAASEKAIVSLGFSTGAGVMNFVDFVLSIGWWSILVAAIVGFSVGYILRGSIWRLHVWPWGDFSTARTLGTGAGFLVGIISVHIRSFLFDLSLSDLAWFALFLAVVSFPAATISAMVASHIQQKKLSWENNKSFAALNAIYVLGLTFKRMDDAERKKYYPSSPDAFIYKAPRTENCIIYEPTLGRITDRSSDGVKYWLAAE